MLRRCRIAASAGIALAVLLASALPRGEASASRIRVERGACVGAPNVIAFRGIVGVDDESAAIGQLRLLHGDRTIPFAVVSAQRLSGAPAEGVEILQRLGPGVPRLRVVGSPRTLAPLLDAKPGATVELRGVLDDANRYFQLLDAEDPPPAEATD
jgi:hypothetical protein